MKRALALVLVLSAAVVSGALASSTRSPALRIVQAKPFVVRGTGFHARERTRVTLYAQETETGLVRATAAGTFRISFGAVTISRCEGFQIVAIGRAGSRAKFVQPPLPECNPE